MNKGLIRIRGGLAAVTVALLLTACLDHPPPPRHPGPYNDPVDAFNATTAPYDPSAPDGANRPLSEDVSHLREARTAYEHSQEVQAARRRDRQAQCRKQPSARLTRIHDGTDDPNAVYCQTPPASRGDHDSDGP